MSVKLAPRHGQNYSIPGIKIGILANFSKILASPRDICQFEKVSKVREHFDSSAWTDKR